MVKSQSCVFWLILLCLNPIASISETSNSKTSASKWKCSKSASACNIDRISQLNLLKISKLRQMLRQYIKYAKQLRKTKIYKAYDYKKFIEKSEFIDAIIQLENQYEIPTNEQHNKQQEKDNVPNKANKNDTQSNPTKQSQQSQQSKRRKPKINKKKPARQRKKSRKNKKSAKLKAENNIVKETNKYDNDINEQAFNLFVFWFVLCIAKLFPKVYDMLTNGIEIHMSLQFFESVTETVIHIYVYYKIIVRSDEKILFFFITNCWYLLQFQLQLFNQFGKNDIFNDYIEKKMKEKYSHYRNLTPLSQKKLLLDGYVRNLTEITNLEYIGIVTICDIVEPYFELCSKYNVLPYIEEHIGQKDKFFNYCSNILRFLLYIAMLSSFFVDSRWEYHVLYINIFCGSIYVMVDVILFVFFYKQIKHYRRWIDTLLKDKNRLSIYWACLTLITMITISLRLVMDLTFISVIDLDVQHMLNMCWVTFWSYILISVMDQIYGVETMAKEKHVFDNYF